MSRSQNDEARLRTCADMGASDDAQSGQGCASNSVQGDSHVMQTAGSLLRLRLGQAVRLLVEQGYTARRPNFTCSTRLPRGNQVDGLPRALTWFPTFAFQTNIGAKISQNLTIYFEN